MPNGIALSDTMKLIFWLQLIVLWQMRHRKWVSRLSCLPRVKVIEPRMDTNENEERYINALKSLPIPHPLNTHFRFLLL